MQGTQRVSAIQPFYERKTKARKPTSKELDLLLLAGCSCLLTVLYHPVAHALQSYSAHNSGSAIASQTSQSSQNSMNAFHLIPASKDEVKEEEEA
uniref:Uncharacterized protein n=1 Tax=Oscillatoriales cyanobacterium SpSt-402 TaxID=2282168 RepID=A0A832M6F7_9CYAN